MIDLGVLKKMLSDGGYTCVLSNGDETFTNRERGVLPLIRLLESGKNLRGFFAADKVVGKAAALLYARMRISQLYAEVIGAAAIETCKKYSIKVSYGVVTPAIVNRKGDDLCPMEKTVAGIEDPQKAYEAIVKKLKELQG